MSWFLVNWCEHSLAPHSGPSGASFPSSQRPTSPAPGTSFLCLNYRSSYIGAKPAGAHAAMFSNPSAERFGATISVLLG